MLAFERADGKLDSQPESPRSASSFASHEIRLKIFCVNGFTNCSSRLQIDVTSFLADQQRAPD